jgi:succinate dehydrogenase / fumarate reductase cytochrome b subunit
MNRLLNLLNTTIGRKLIVALSGVVLVLFVIGHAVGNLTLYMGSDALNAYAHFLQSSPVLWFVRAAMLAIVLAHILLAVAVSKENKRARRMRYCARRSPLQIFLDNRMVVSGIVLMIFIVAHVAHLTIGVGVGDVFTWLDERGYKDVFARVVIGFENPFVAWGYILAMLLLAIHLQHSVRALFQTLGFFHENYFDIYEVLAWIVTIFVVVALGSIPLVVQLGLIDSPQQFMPMGGAS